MSGIETVVPFFGGDPFRRRNLDVVLKHLRAGELVGGRPVSVIVPGVGEAHGRANAEDVRCFPIWVEEGESQAHARNAGAENCVSPVIYFNDADSLVPFDQIVEAVKMAALGNGLVFAFTDYIRLDPEGVPCEHIPGSGSSGAVAISRQCFEDVGGYDERFTGWGYEDLDFAARCAALWPIRRVPGELRHLWHPPAGGRSESQRDVAVTDEQKRNLELYAKLCNEACVVDG